MSICIPTAQAQAPLQLADIAGLVRQDRVHRSIYQDPAIFALEQRQLFGKAWLYIGHESQIPNPGDFVTLKLGTQPVVFVRHRDGTVHVLYNRCGHRGAVVCNEPKGNAASFQCCYHGWTFATDGALVGVPQRKGYAADIDLRDPSLGMVRLPRVASYRGFVFASRSADGPDLDSFLGPVRKSIDDIIALSPDEEIAVVGGVHKYEFRGNWKHQIENLNDMYHPFFSHASTVEKDGRQFQRRSGDTEGAQLGGQSGGPNAVFEKIPLRGFGFGHSLCGAMPFNGERGGPVFEEYRRRLTARHGEERTREILTVDWHNTIIYPNLCLQSAAQHIRVINPVAVDRTEVYVYPILLKGVPDQINHDVIRYLNVTHAAASLIQTDDLEAFERIQSGIETDGADWLVLARGADKDVKEADGSWSGIGTSELPMRNQYRAWTHYLSEGAL